MADSDDARAEREAPGADPAGDGAGNGADGESGDAQIRLRLERVSKSFTLGDATVPVLRDIDLELAGGAAVAVTGPSGSGKSTLLHLIGALDQPTSGSLTVDGEDPFQRSETELARFRNETVGFIFQDHHLLPQYSVLENVLLPTLAFPGGDAGADERARRLLDRVGLDHRLDHRPAELSGGERQRVAVARALINRPSLLLCDEPTGNLDRDSAGRVADLLFELHRERSEASGGRGSAPRRRTDGRRQPAGRPILIVVTHSLELAARLPRRFELRDGRPVEAGG